MPWTRNAHVAEPRASSSKTRMNSSPIRLPLLLRVGDAREAREEALLRLDVHERDVEVAAERLDHLLRLALAQEAVVDEDARELVADRLVDEQRRDGRVDAAGERAEHALASRPARGSARPAPRSRPPASTPAARRRRRRGSSSGRPARAACARPPGGTGRRRGRARRLEGGDGRRGGPAGDRAPAGGAMTESRWLIQTVCSAAGRGRARPRRR